MEIFGGITIEVHGFGGPIFQRSFQDHYNTQPKLIIYQINILVFIKVKSTIWILSSKVCGVFIQPLCLHMIWNKCEWFSCYYYTLWCLIITVFHVPWPVLLDINPGCHHIEIFPQPFLVLTNHFSIYLTISVWVHLYQYFVNVLFQFMFWLQYIEDRSGILKADSANSGLWIHYLLRMEDTIIKHCNPPFIKNKHINQHEQYK